MPPANDQQDQNSFDQPSGAPDQNAAPQQSFGAPVDPTPPVGGAPDTTVPPAPADQDGDTQPSADVPPVPGADNTPPANDDQTPPADQSL